MNFVTVANVSASIENHARPLTSEVNWNDSRELTRSIIDHGFLPEYPITIIVGSVLSKLKQESPKVLRDNLSSELAADTSKDVKLVKMVELAVYIVGANAEKNGTYDPQHIGNGNCRFAALCLSVACKLMAKRDKTFSERLKTAKAELKKLSGINKEQAESKLPHPVDFITKPIAKYGSDEFLLIMVELVESLESLELPAIEKEYSTVNELLISCTLANNDKTAKKMVASDKFEIGMRLLKNRVSRQDVKKAIGNGEGDTCYILTRIDKRILKHNKENPENTVQRVSHVVTGMKGIEESTPELIKFVDCLRNRSELFKLLYLTDVELFADDIEAWNNHGSHKDAKHKIDTDNAIAIPELYATFIEIINKPKVSDIFQLTKSQQSEFLSEAELYSEELKSAFADLFKNSPEKFWSKMEVIFSETVEVTENETETVES